MPRNPLTAVQVTSKPPPERPEAIPPVPEVYQGVNQPYRGTQEHGVTPNAEPHPTQADWDTREGRTYLKPEEEQEPVPVRIVQQHGAEFRRYRVHRMSVDNTRGVQLVGRNMARNSILVQNRDDVDSVFFYHDPIDPVSGPAIGFEIGPGEDHRIDSQDAVYIVGEGATLSTVQAIEYYSVEL